MQKAELELPVKQFHRLYDLLGDLIDYEAEINVFNMENNDIELLRGYTALNCSTKYLTKKPTLIML